MVAAAAAGATHVELWDGVHEIVSLVDGVLTFTPAADLPEGMDDDAVFTLIEPRAALVIPADLAEAGCGTAAPRPGLRGRVEWQETESRATTERANDAEVPLVERSDVLRPDARSQDDKRSIREADPQVGVSIGQLGCFPGGTRPPLDQVGACADIVAKGAHRSRAPARRGKVIGFSEHERCRHELFVEPFVPLERLAMTAIGTVEKRVDEGGVEDDHSPPKPVSARWRSTSSATSPGPRARPIAVIRGRSLRP